MPDIVLSTLNSRFSHASLGLRYLLANMGDLAERTRLVEFVINQRPLDIVERLLALEPRIIGFGVYIWNIVETTQVVALLKQVRPDIQIVLGGPEVSHEQDQQAIIRDADYVISGPGDVSFAKLCQAILFGPKPLQKRVAGEQVPLAQLQLPYPLYSDRDLAHRLVYVEASRGCPFKCEFCLSSLDKTSLPFPLDAFLQELEHLYQRGARTFKFVDRTFNLNIKTSLQILDFFLQRLTADLFVHFEVIPDHLPDKLKQAIAQFPAGTLQLEIGIQTFNPEVQALISRKQDNAKTEANLRWLREHSQAHIHADLIAGLPGETLESFATGFDRLLALGPQEIQLGILKRLRGTPLARHTEAFEMRYNPLPPYNILRNRDLDFVTLQRLNRFARYWDLIANSGRFRQTLPQLLGSQPFAEFMSFSDWLWQHSQQTYQIALERLFDLVYQWLSQQPQQAQQAAQTLLQDYRDTGARGNPAFLQKLGNPA